MTSTLTKRQYKNYGPRPIAGYGDGAAIWAHVRFDDECGNGHNTFAITGTIRVPRQRDAESCGCLHDEIAQAFPKLAPLIKWHLCSTDGPMGYIANACYFAGDRDCWGHAAGEPSSFDLVMAFRGFPLEWKTRDQDFMRWLRSEQIGPENSWQTSADYEVIQIDHERDRKTFGSKWTIGGAPDKWHECPFDTEREALQFLAALQMGWRVLTVPTAWSEGKPRELDKARNAAIWPDATDEDLTAPGLKERLEARLPGLLAEFCDAVESLGFTW
jgi:hypothetical protein